MAWSVMVNEVSRPGLDTVRVQFTLQKDGLDFVSDELTFTEDQFEKLTASGKLDLVRTAIKQRCQSYIKIDRHVEDLKPLEKQVVSVVAI